MMQQNQFRQDEIVYGGQSHQIRYRSIAINILCMGIMLAVNKLGAPGNAIFFIVLSYIALKSSEGAVKAISLCMLVLVSNVAFATKSGMIFAPMRFGILFIAVARIFYDLNLTGSSLFSKKYYLALCAFVGVSSVLSIIGGYFVIISQLKLLSFLVGTTAILGGAEIVKRKGSDLTGWFYSLIVFTLIMGVGAWVGGVGYNAKTEFEQYSGLFNGPFFHPQTLGPACALMITYLVCVLLYTPYRRRLLSMGLILVLLVFLYKTSSRTAVIGLAAGLAASIGFGIILHQLNQYFVRMNFSRVQLVMAGIGLVLLIGAVDLFSGFHLSSKARDYVFKGGDSMVALGSSTTDALMATRQGQIDMMLHGISQQPLTGIGFGTSADANFGVRAKLLSAPTEKGFLPLAIVEETGLIGTLFFVIFLLLIYAELIRQRNLAGLGLFTAMLGCNIGEMSFFSFGGQGAFLWVLVGAGIVLGPKCINTGWMGFALNIKT